MSRRSTRGRRDNPLMLTFELLATEGHARRGRLTLNHGVVETPVFMPVGTYGTRQGRAAARRSRRWARRSSSATPSTSGCGPASTSSRSFGGLHRFEGWTRPILTDSGGFQVWSLGEMRKISEEGVNVRVARQRRQAAAHARGQHADPDVLDSDIVMQFDECTPYETEGHDHRPRPRRARRWS